MCVRLSTGVLPCRHLPVQCLTSGIIAREPFGVRLRFRLQVVNFFPLFQKRLLGLSVSYPCLLLLLFQLERDEGVRNFCL